jgi:hypothetical protein
MNPRNRKDETGRVYGRLRVLKKYPKHDRGKAVWICYCDPALGGCGRTVAVRGVSLRSGVTRSCGCLRAESCGRRMKELWQKRKENTE